MAAFSHGTSELGHGDCDVYIAVPPYGVSPEVITQAELVCTRLKLRYFISQGQRRTSLSVARADPKNVSVLVACWGLETWDQPRDIWAAISAQIPVIALCQRRDDYQRSILPRELAYHNIGSIEFIAPSDINKDDRLFCVFIHALSTRNLTITARRKQWSETIQQKLQATIPTDRAEFQRNRLTSIVLPDEWERRFALLQKPSLDDPYA